MRTQEEGASDNLDMISRNTQKNQQSSQGDRRNRQSEVSKRDSASASGPESVARPRSFSTMVESRTENLRAVAKEMQGQALRRLSFKM